MKLLRRLVMAEMLLVAFVPLWLPRLLPGTYKLGVFVVAFSLPVNAILLAYLNSRGESDWRRVRTRVRQSISKKNLLWGLFYAIAVVALLIPQLYPWAFPIAIFLMLLLLPLYYLAMFAPDLFKGSEDHGRNLRRRR